jgi:Domain of unknown function (DUF1707).
VATGPWDPHAAAIGRMRASDADRDRVVDALKAAYAQGLLSTDELAARTSQALAARTYADLTAASAVLAERPVAVHPPARQDAGQQEGRGLRHQRDGAGARPGRRVPHVLRRLHHPCSWWPASAWSCRPRRWPRGPRARCQQPAAADQPLRGPEDHRPRCSGIIDLVASIDLDRLAKTAYDAHRSAHPGPLPSWDDISDQEKKAWRAAVTAVTGSGESTVTEGPSAQAIAVQAGDDTHVFHTEFTAGRQGSLVLSDDTPPATTPCSSRPTATGSSRTSARPTAPGSTAAACSRPSG